MTPKRQGPEEFLEEGELFAKLGELWDATEIKQPPTHVWSLTNGDYLRAAGYTYEGDGCWIHSSALPGQDEEC